MRKDLEIDPSAMISSRKDEDGTLEFSFACCRCGEAFWITEKNRQLKALEKLCPKCEQTAQEAFNLLWELAKEAPLEIRCMMRRASRFAKDHNLNSWMRSTLDHDWLQARAALRATLQEAEARRPSTKREKFVDSILRLKRVPRFLRWPLVQLKIHDARTVSQEYQRRAVTPTERRRRPRVEVAAKKQS